MDKGTWKVRKYAFLEKVHTWNNSKIIANDQQWSDK